MSEEIMTSAADLATVAQLRAQVKALSLQIGEQNTTIGYQDAMLSVAYHALQSYAHGNSAPDLAIEAAAHLQKAVEKVRDE